MSEMNRIANSKNEFQGGYKRVLCVCSAGLLRSPTAAFVLSQEPFNFNTRAAGLISQFALIVVDDVLLHWADEVVCMTEDQAEVIRDSVLGFENAPDVYCLDIEDNYAYRNPELIALIKERYQKLACANARS